MRDGLLAQLIRAFYAHDVVTRLGEGVRGNGETIFRMFLDVAI
jgi:hypothetical protein